MGQNPERNRTFLTRREFLEALTFAAGGLFLSEIGGLKSVAAEEIPPDFDLPDGPGLPEGHFYTQTRGEAPFPKGYLVFNGEVPMWSVFQQVGGVTRWGYPISNQYKDEIGKVCQAFQKGIFQITVETGGKVAKVEWANILDELADRGINLDNPQDLVPHSFDWSDDARRSWGHDRWGGLLETVEANHLERVFAQVREFPQLEEFYFANPLWFEQYGLPMSVKDYGRIVVVRCQRVVLQLWKDKTPWTNEPGAVVLANGGELAKKYGLIPPKATEPVDNPYGVGEKVEQYVAEPVFWHGDQLKPYVYLTIDDFWDPRSLDPILEIAKANGLKLTLFPVGSVMGKNPAGFRRAVAKGHTIENHTQTHAWLSTLSEEQIRWQIRTQKETVRAILGNPNYQQRFLRPPGGAGILGYQDERLLKIAQEEGYKIAMWTADSNGFRVSPRTDEEAKNYVLGSIRRGLGNGSIVLQHATPSDVAVLGLLGNEVKSRGLRPLTLGQGIR